ncbi:hypothetical protein TNCV_3777971 [Trichonephila clavipes]|nr:hypothetical protein TNCV_3777971 [Trichonephila clavipes]
MGLASFLWKRYSHVHLAAAYLRVEAWPPPQPLFDSRGICSHRSEDETRELQEGRIPEKGGCCPHRMGWRDGML